MQAVAIVFPIVAARHEVGCSSLTAKRPYDCSSRVGRSASEELYAALTGNFEQLLDFAADKEFSAENILFLRAVIDYKAKWMNTLGPNSAANSKASTLRKDAFSEAAYIYHKLVHPTTAKFNVNLESDVYRSLEGTFAGVPYTITNCKNRDLVVPWEDTASTSAMITPQDSAESITMAPFELGNVQLLSRDGWAASGDTVKGALEIPIDFSFSVFDEAYRSITRLVLTNTWPRYVKAYGSSPKCFPAPSNG